jgi:hypothetical protein
MNSVFLDRLTPADCFFAVSSPLRDVSFVAVVGTTGGILVAAPDTNVSSTTEAIS